MVNSSVFDRTVSEPGSYATANAVVKLKSFEFHFRREPAEFVPDPDFVPFLWEKRNDGNDDGGANEAEEDDAMDTSEGRGDPSVTAVSQGQSGGSGGGGSSNTGISRGAGAILALTPFNNDPQTTVAKEVVARLREVSPELERRLTPVEPTASDLAAAFSPVSSSPSMPPGRPVLPARGRVHTLARTPSGTPRSLGSSLSSPSHRRAYGGQPGESVHALGPTAVRSDAPAPPASVVGRSTQAPAAAAVQPTAAAVMPAEAGYSVQHGAGSAAAAASSHAALVVVEDGAQASQAAAAPPLKGAAAHKQQRGPVAAAAATRHAAASSATAEERCRLAATAATAARRELVEAAASVAPSSGLCAETAALLRTSQRSDGGGLGHDRSLAAKAPTSQQSSTLAKSVTGGGLRRPLLPLRWHPQAASSRSPLRVGARDMGWLQMARKPRTRTP
nr:Holliday junction resolvase MOC1, chloroplastic-like [Lolium perenne]